MFFRNKPTPDFPSFFVEINQHPFFSLRTFGAVLIGLIGIILAVPNGTDVFVTGGELIVTGGELLVETLKGLGKTVKFLKTVPAWGWAGRSSWLAATGMFVTYKLHGSR